MFRVYIEINGTKIKREREIKLLGITIDEKLNFDKHVDILCKKAARQINSNIFLCKRKESYI